MFIDIFLFCSVNGSTKFMKESGQHIMALSNLGQPDKLELLS